MLCKSIIRRLQAQFPTENDPMAFARAIEKCVIEECTTSRNKDVHDLVTALSSLLYVIPAEVECNNMHHVPKHRHFHDETCPVVVAYGNAILQASKVLAKARKP